MYCLRGSILVRISDRRVVLSAAIGRRAAAPAATVPGAARLTGLGISARSWVSLTRVTGKALAEPVIAGAAAPQLWGTERAPTVVARPATAVTGPPVSAEPAEPTEAR